MTTNEETIFSDKEITAIDEMLHLVATKNNSIPPTKSENNDLITASNLLLCRAIKDKNEGLAIGAIAENVEKVMGKVVNALKDYEADLLKTKDEKDIDWVGARKLAALIAKNILIEHLYQE